MAVELVELVDRLTIVVVVHRFPCMGVADYRSLRSGICIRMKESIRRSTTIPFRRFWDDARRDLMQRLFVVLHGTLGSHLHDALREGNAGAVACVLASMASTLGGAYCHCLVGYNDFSNKPLVYITKGK
jgi:hypothetical protein